jgi:hypothetical protein
LFPVTAMDPTQPEISAIVQLLVVSGMRFHPCSTA